MAMNLDKFRPMKSATPEPFELEKLPWPMWASPKIDGIRCVIHPTLGPVTNTLKPIPNGFIREYLSNHCPPYLDGELVVGDPDNPKSFNQTQSGVMSHNGRPDFTYLVFDHFESGNTCGFGIRKEDARTVIMDIRAEVRNNRIQLLEHDLLESYEQMLEYEAICLSRGYEGVMLRHPQGKYKFGRSTMKQAGMVKVKRFRDDEAIIIGWEPLELNRNDPTINQLGLQVRGYSNSGKVIDDSRVGRFRVKGIKGSRWEGVEFWIGSGLDDADRITFREQLRNKHVTPWPVSYTDEIGPEDHVPPHQPIGQIITFKYQEHGSKDAPRTPIWKGIRKDI